MMLKKPRNYIKFSSIAQTPTLKDNSELFQPNLRKFDFTRSPASPVIISHYDIAEKPDNLTLNPTKRHPKDFSRKKINFPGKL